MHSVGLWWMWAGFFGFFLSVLMIDMYLLGGTRTHKVSVREALVWTLTWICCAFLFDAVLWYYLNKTAGFVVANQKALEFLTGFIIEKSLSADNLFVFLMIFIYFSVPLSYQRRILLYGVWGAIILRFVLIASGTALVAKLHWILYLFGLFLVISGIKMLFITEEEKDFSQDPIVRWLSKHLNISNKLHGNHFFVKQGGVYYATRLFLVLVLIEISDVIFAFDSIPAIFAITQDAFIVFTSNMFAILGLRALYFILADMAERFHLLKYGIALILAFVGFKILIEPWVQVSIPLALTLVVAILGATVILSILIPTSSQHKR